MNEIKIQMGKDGLTIKKIIVGENHYQVTLITPAEQELKPVEGKWYRFIGENNEFFRKERWYQCKSSGTCERVDWCTFTNDAVLTVGSRGLFPIEYYRTNFDLTTPLDFDPETLVGKTLEWKDGAKAVIRKIEWPLVFGDHLGTNNYSSDLMLILNQIKDGSIKVLDPEPTLTVPENVEFVMWCGDLALVYNGLILTGVDNGFMLEDVRSIFNKIPTLKLIPCKLSEVQNGEWVVNQGLQHDPPSFRLKTEKGWVSFNGSSESPISLCKKIHNADVLKWLKVVQG